MENLKTILIKMDISLDKLQSEFEVKDNQYISSNKNNISLLIEIEGAIPIFLLYSRDTNYFEIKLKHQEDPEISFEGKQLIGTKNKSIEESVSELLKNYYILETRGGKEAYLHYLNTNGEFLYSQKCVNLPGLLFGKREFKIYTPLIDVLKLYYSL